MVLRLHLCITYFGACGKIGNIATTKKIGKNLQLEKGEIFNSG
jgi:hypothetical protein